MAFAGLNASNGRAFLLGFTSTRTNLVAPGRTDCEIGTLSLNSSTESDTCHSSRSFSTRDGSGHATYQSRLQQNLLHHFGTAPTVWGGVGGGPRVPASFHLCVKAVCYPAGCRSSLREASLFSFSSPLRSLARPGTTRSPGPGLLAVFDMEVLRDFDGYEWFGSRPWMRV